MEKERQNLIRIIGTLVENRLREGVAKSGKSVGKSYISGDIIIKCVIDGKDELFPIRLYAFDTTQAGQPNKLYASYKNLANLINRRVSVTGYLSENRFWSAKTSVIAVEQRLNGRFISEAPISETTDSATFEFSGYVATKLTAKTRKGETVPYIYELICGQENTKGTSASMFHFHVAPDRTDIIDSINRLYSIGATVKFSGDLRYVSQRIEKKDDKPAFGTPTARAYIVTNKYFYITTGDNPITGDTAYVMDEMKKFKASRVEADMDIQNRAKNAATAEDASSDANTTAADDIETKPAASQMDNLI
jgi:hypothetical protein